MKRRIMSRSRRKSVSKEEEEKQEMMRFIKSYLFVTFINSECKISGSNADIKENIKEFCEDIKKGVLDNTAEERATNTTTIFDEVIDEFSNSIVRIKGTISGLVKGDSSLD